MPDPQESEQLAAVRTERTSAKRAVTMAAKRVRQGVELNMATVGDMVKKLDDRLLEFLDVCEKFKEIAVSDTPIVNGMGPSEYEEETLGIYTEAMDLYRSDQANNSQCENSANQLEKNIRLRLRKQEIPKFSGLRSDWPEFKKIWEELVRPAIPNEIVLAAELKTACKDGRAFEEIKNISAGAEGAYFRMWENLCDHYDNIVLSVASALADLKKLRSVKSDDHRATVELINKIDCVLIN